MLVSSFSCFSLSSLLRAMNVPNSVCGNTLCKAAMCVCMCVCMCVSCMCDVCVWACVNMCVLCTCVAWCVCWVCERGVNELSINIHQYHTHTHSYTHSHTLTFCFPDNCNFGWWAQSKTKQHAQHYLPIEGCQKLREKWETMIHVLYFSSCPYVVSLVLQMVKWVNTQCGPFQVTCLLHNIRFSYSPMRGQKYYLFGMWANSTVLVHCAVTGVG